MDELQQDWDRQSELLERILDGEPVEDVLASEPDAAVREAVLSMLQHHREAEKTGFLDAPPTLVRALHEGTDGPSLKGGERLNDRFVILRHIGSGGMGEVYLARDEVMNDDVALKIIRPELSEDPRIRTRFIAEVRNARRVTHTNVCHVYDIVERAELPFFTMEYLPGRTLAEALGAGSLDGAAKKRIAAQLANGLDAAHLRGIIHRDFKPANVMLTERNGRLDAVIMDFGLARTEEMTDPGNAHSLQAGTEEYMAPELLQGSKATLQSDVYAYGKVLQQLLPNHPLLSKLLAERPEDRQPSLRAVIASFDDANGKATRRTWMLGTAAAAATGYGVWRTFESGKPTILRRAKLLLNPLLGRQVQDSELNVARNLMAMALRQSPSLAVIDGMHLLAELRKAGMSEQLPASADTLRTLAAREGAVYVVTGELALTGSRLILTGHLDSSAAGQTLLRTAVTADSGQIMKAVEDLALRVRKAVGESTEAMRRSYSTLEQVTSAYPEAVEYYFAAVQKYEQADSDGALAYTERAITIDPEFVLALHYHSLALNSKALTAEALEYSRHAFDRRARLADRERLWVEAVYYTISANYKKAEESYRNAVALFPEEALFHRQLASVQSVLGDFASAVKNSSAALDIDPFSENTKSECIVNAAESMDYQGAIARFDEFRRSGDSSPLLDWGAGLARIGSRDPVRAEVHFRAMGTRLEWDRWSRLLETIPLFYKGQWTQAAHDLRAELQLDQLERDASRRGEITRWLAWTHFFLGEKHAARPYIQELSAAQPLPCNLDHLRVAARLAAQIGDNESFQRGLDGLSSVADRFPSPKASGYLYHVRAVSCACVGRIEDAAVHASLAARFWPDTQTLISDILLRKRRNKDAADGVARLKRLEGQSIRREWPGWLFLLWLTLAIGGESCATSRVEETERDLVRGLASTQLRSVAEIAVLNKSGDICERLPRDAWSFLV